MTLQDALDNLFAHAGDERDDVTVEAYNTLFEAIARLERLERSNGAEN